MSAIITYVFHQLAKTAIGLSILGALWLANTILGSGKAIIDPTKTWSWKTFRNGFLEAIVLAAAITLGIVAISLIPFIFAMFGLELTDAQKQAIDITQLFAAIAAGISVYGVRFIKNLSTKIGADEADAPKIDADATALKHFDATEAFAKTTITEFSGKEQLDKDGVDIDHGTEIEPGKGSANTYPSYLANAAPDTITDPSTCYNRECVSYAAWKIAETGKGWPRRTGDMNAKSWVSRMPENGHREVTAGEVLAGLPNGGRYVGILTAGTYGHALWAESASGVNVNVSEYNYSYAHGYGQRTISPGAYRWFEIVAAAKPTPIPAPVPQPAKPVAPAPAPAPEPAKPQPRVTFDQPTNNNFTTGQSVIAWGRGASDRNGGGIQTRNFGETAMKIIAQQNGRLALNQYNSGAVGDASAVTGWWPTSQVRKI